MKRINVVSIQLVKEKTFAYEYTKTVRQAADAADIINKFLDGADREHFVVLCLDTKNNVTAINTVHIGDLNSSIVNPREVFKPAILANAASVIVGHNHPSGSVAPSKEDVMITKRLQEAGRILCITVLDHVIVPGDRDNGQYTSLKQAGTLD